MWLDYEYFGYGVGLVLVGWFLGMCIKVIFSIFSRVGSICVLFMLPLLFLSSSASALMPVTFQLVDTAQYSKDLVCEFSTLNTGAKAEEVYFYTSSETRRVSAPSQLAFSDVMRVRSSNTGTFNVDLSVAGDNYTMQLVSCEESSAEKTYQQIASFFLGGFMGIAFCLASSNSF
jgi:hypothetical protein